MNKVKKALFVFFVGVGVSFGIAGSASALVPCEACYVWLEDCQNGDQAACTNYYKPIHRCAGC